MAYAAGEDVVHPQHGTAVVQGVVKKDLGAGPVDYLELYVKSASMTVLVPADSVKEIGLRDLSSKRDAQDILALLQEPADVPERWKERHAMTVARMKSGDLDQIAMVVRDLTQHARRIGKPLNQGEKSALERCLAILSEELSLSLDITEDDTLSLISENSPDEPEPDEKVAPETAEAG